MTDAVFYTVTMAKVYAEQGYYEQSAEIYRFLLKNDPGRQDLVAALSEVEKKLFRPLDFQSETVGEKLKNAEGAL